MPSITLSSIEWHDLPLVEICISETGLSLTVIPYDEDTASYGRYVLRITDTESMSLKVIGSPSAKDLGSMEVSTFTYSIDVSGRITGSLGVLPGHAGFWKISFVNARWELTRA